MVEVVEELGAFRLIKICYLPEPALPLSKIFFGLMNNA